VKQVIVVLGLAAIFAGTVAVAGELTDVFDDRPPPPDLAVRTVETTTADQGADAELAQTERRNRRAREEDARVRWARAANAACAGANREARQLLREHGTPGSLDELAYLGEKAFAVQDRLMDRLRALPQPRSERAEIRRMLLLYQRGSRFLQRALGALEEGRYSPVLRWADAGVSTLMEASDVALALGATKCGADMSGAGLGSLGVAIQN
jgi:hypothetical protein